MSNDWFRSWHGAPTDNKWLLIAKRAGVRPIHVCGTWWALLDHASQHSVRGTVDDFDVETFALFAGMEEEHVSRIVTVLSDKGMIVDGRISNWGKRQPKKEDETAGARKRRQRDKSGGNLPPTGGADHTHNGSGHAASRNVTLDKEKIREEEERTLPNGSGTVVPIDAAAFCKIVFESGAASLMNDNPGLDNRGAREIVGRWRKKVSDSVLLDIFRGADSRGASLFLEYVTRAVENHHVEPGRPSRGSENRTRNAAQRVAQRFGIASGGSEDENGSAASRLDAGRASGMPVALLSGGNG